MGNLVPTKSYDITDDNFNDFSSENARLPILDDILVDIFVFVPSIDLIKNCRAVCKTWKELIDGQSVWKLKCKREKKFIPAIKFPKKVPDHFYRQIYLHDPYGRNLVINPCGEDGLNGWELVANGGDRFTVENPPGGADPVPSEVGSQACFATSFLPCAKHQIVDLLSEGISKEILQLKTTKIQISEWYAARFDCASEYTLTVLLLSDKWNIYDMNSYDLCKVDEFNFNFNEDQWAGRAWHKVTHEFENVGNVQYVYFQHHGKDRQFWAGHYGIKMTGASVRIVV